MKNFIVWLYMLLRYRKRYYYVCVTGLQLDGVRMFGGGILITTFGVVPVMAAAKKLLEKFEMREPDKELISRIHRKFHYIVSSWLSEQGAD